MPDLILFAQLKICEKPPWRSVTEVCNFTKSNTPSWMFFTFFYKWYQIAQSITLWFYKEDFHRSMKKWVKRENWNIENKRNIFQATFNVIFFSPVLIFKNIKIEVKKRKKSFLKMYFMFTFSQLQKTVTFRRTVCYVYPQFCIWAQKWVNITPTSICSVLSTSPLDTRHS